MADSRAQRRGGARSRRLGGGQAILLGHHGLTDSRADVQRGELIAEVTPEGNRSRGVVAELRADRM